MAISSVKSTLHVERMSTATVALGLSDGKGSLFNVVESSQLGLMTVRSLTKPERKKIVHIYCRIF